MGKRLKTNVSYNVPLLDVPKMILEKYKGILPNGELLPLISNQKVNAYLKSHPIFFFLSSKFDFFVTISSYFCHRI